MVMMVDHGISWSSDHHFHFGRIFKIFCQSYVVSIYYNHITDAILIYTGSIIVLSINDTIERHPTHQVICKTIFGTDMFT